jgi:hypothetical protein
MQCTCTHTTHKSIKQGKKKKKKHSLCANLCCLKKRREILCTCAASLLLDDDDDDELKTFKSSKPKTKRCPKKEKKEKQYDGWIQKSVSCSLSYQCGLGKVLPLYSACSKSS